MSLYDLSEDDLKAMSHAQLLQLVILERGKRRKAQIDAAGGKKKFKDTEVAKHADNSQKKKKKKKNEFSMDKYSVRHVALKIAYLGWNYRGLARQVGCDDTIEHHLFTALEKSKLIQDRKECQFSRSGRTDKGVSAFEQVVSLDVRSVCTKGVGIVKLPKDFVRSDADDDDQEETELDYVRILNNIMPADIRVTAWAAVLPNLDARFSTIHRTYRYYFFDKGYDLVAMRRAARLFVGEHDFRNFCKTDLLAIVSHVRTIVAFDLHVLENGPAERAPWRGRLCELKVCGFAFLWHQVRNMASVLFMVGRGYEQPEIVSQLLDIEKLPRKPMYNMAPDLPLVLTGAAYESIEWQRSGEPKVAVALREQATQLATQLAIVDGYLEYLHEPPSLPDEAHVPLLQRSCEPSYEERLERHAKSKRKQDDNDDE